jgi:hypothetical protein
MAEHAEPSTSIADMRTLATGCPPITRRSLLSGLAGALSLLGCDSRRLPDSRKQAWAAMVDLSGTAAEDREEYVRALEEFIRETGRTKPSLVMHVAGFSGFARALVSGQAQQLLDRWSGVADEIRSWPRDARTSLDAAYQVAYDLLRKVGVERRVVWVLGDGIHDPTNRWRARPAFAVALPAELPFERMRDEGFVVHWDALDEHQLRPWLGAFERAKLPAVLHLRGYAETAHARLRRLPRDEIDRA